MCINIFTEYAVYDYYRKNHPADSPAEYYRRTLAIPLLDCIISELDSRFSSLSRTASKALYLVPTIAVDGEHDLNDFVSLYEKDLVDKYLLDQEITHWKRKLSLEERPDSLGAALQQCDEERF